MLPTFPYTAMTITGILHVIMGSVIFINYCVIWGVTVIHYKVLAGIFYGTAIGCSFWIIVVGILGILTGKKRADHRKTQCLKLAYMVTAILSAALFSPVVLTISIFVHHMRYIYGFICCFTSVTDIIISIVSSSICCCGENSSSSTIGVELALNEAPPGNNPPGTYPPGTYPPVYRSPPEGVTNPGYQINPNSAN